MTPASKNRVAAVSAAILLLAVYTGAALGENVNVTLAGNQEVPQVNTQASGSGTITVNADKTVSGSITTKGLVGTMAHIHEGATGKNGGVVVPLTKSGDNGWTVPAGAKLSDAQYKSFKAGDLYVNVHTAANKGGEIRGQLKP